MSTQVAVMERDGVAGRHDHSREVAVNVAMIFIAPLAGLLYAVTYGTVGLATAFCYGLKAFGVSCGVFKN